MVRQWGGRIQGSGGPFVVSGHMTGVPVVTVRCRCGRKLDLALLATAVALYSRRCPRCKRARLYIFRDGEFVGAPELKSRSEIALTWALREVGFTEDEVKEVLSTARASA